MSVAFDRIPQSQRRPLTYFEFDPSKANSGATDSRGLIIGQKLADGTAVANVPFLGTSLAAVKAACGIGSMAARMYEIWRKNDVEGEVWILPLDEDAAGVANVQSATFTGPATAPGTIFLDVAGQRVTVAVASGDTAAQIATSVAAAIEAAASLPVNAAVDGVTTSKVNLTCKWKGLSGADIDLRVNRNGAAGDEQLPAGVTVAFASVTAGTLNPDIGDGLANLGDDEYDFIALPYTDTVNLDAFKAFMDDVSGRWSYAWQIYGHGFSHKGGSVATRAAFGVGRNDPAICIMGSYRSPSSPWEWAASFAAEAAVSIRAHAARPLQTLPLVGIIAPDRADRDTTMEQETLLHDGIATYTVDSDGTVRIGREVTTYQKNAYGQDDDAWLDLQRRTIGWTFVRRLRAKITSEFPRHLLAEDGTRFGEGQPITTPKDIKAILVGEYAAMERDGLVQDAQWFIDNSIVEIDPNNKNRANLLLAPDFIGQLRIVATKVQFV